MKSLNIRKTVILLLLSYKFLLNLVLQGLCGKIEISGEVRSRN